MKNSSFDKYKQSGVGLIEVLVTALILSTALLALAGLQTRSLQYNTSAYLRSQANILAYDILDRVRISSDVANGVLDTPDVQELAAAQLPGGEGNIECSIAAGSCTVTLSWTEPTVNEAQDGSETATFSYQSQI